MLGLLFANRDLAEQVANQVHDYQTLALFAMLSKAARDAAAARGRALVQQQRQAFAFLDDRAVRLAFADQTRNKPAFGLQPPRPLHFSSTYLRRMPTARLATFATRTALLDAIRAAFEAPQQRRKLLPDAAVFRSALRSTVNSVALYADDSHAMRRLLELEAAAGLVEIDFASVPVAVCSSTGLLAYSGGLVRYPAPAGASPACGGIRLHCTWVEGDERSLRNFGVLQPVLHRMSFLELYVVYELLRVYRVVPRKK